MNQRWVRGCSSEGANKRCMNTATCTKLVPPKASEANVWQLFHTSAQVDHHFVPTLICAHHYKNWEEEKPRGGLPQSVSNSRTHSEETWITAKLSFNFFSSPSFIPLTVWTHLGNRRAKITFSDEQVTITRGKAQQLPLEVSKGNGEMNTPSPKLQQSVTGHPRSKPITVATREDPITWNGQ